MSNIEAFLGGTEEPKKKISLNEMRYAEYEGNHVYSIFQKLAGKFLYICQVKISRYANNDQKVVDAINAALRKKFEKDIF